MRITDPMFEEWIRQHHRLLFSIAYWWTGSRSDAEELTQEAFFQAYRSRDTLLEAGAARSWLVGILRNCHAQMRRKEYARAEVPLESLQDIRESERLANTGDQIDLRRALQKLDERYRLPVVLYYFEELSYAEIASALNLPIGTVMSRLSRGRKQLFALLCSSGGLTLVKAK